MRIKNKRQLLSMLLSVIVSVFLVGITVYAATTIGTNIVTTGTTSMTTASTTGNFWLGNLDAEDDDFLYMDASSTEYLMWDDNPGEFVLSDDLKISGWASSTSATTTDYMYIGPDITEPTSGWDFTGGDLIISDDLFVNSQATTSVSLWVGSSGAPTNINMTGGDLYVLDDAEIDGDLFVTGTASSTNAIISGNATTTGNMVIGYNNQAANATTTVTFGSYDGDNATGVCLKLRQGNAWVYCYTSGGAFTCSATSCE